MTSLASILTMNTLKRSDNLKFIVLGLIISVLMFYFKDLSLALGQTGRIPLILAVWAPVIALSLFTFIGVLQINENNFLIFCIFFLVLRYLLRTFDRVKNITLNKKEATSLFEGEVKIRTSDNYVIRSDYAEYNKDLGIVKLKGNISALDEKDNKIITNEAIYNEKLKTLKSIGLTEVTT